MNCDGSSMASHSTLANAAAPGSSTSDSRACSAWPVSWNSVMTSSCVSSAALSPLGREKLHVR
ncbi:Uncharacterised protein [Bordetella pertussis]|nr:Uncharacterised protein [Bordetella pertussis]CFV97656.1 Uncharacterised protein [Bordetella pertussis]